MSTPKTPEEWADRGLREWRGGSSCGDSALDLAVREACLAAVADELREQAHAMREEVAQLYEAGRDDWFATRLEQRAEELTARIR